MNQYFINVDSTLPKNNLHRALQARFEPFEHKLIGEEQLHILELNYKDAVLGYQSEGGKCSAPGYWQHEHGGIVFVRLCESLELKLILVKGTVADDKPGDNTLQP